MPDEIDYSYIEWNYPEYYEWRDVALKRLHMINLAASAFTAMPPLFGSLELRPGKRKSFSELHDDGYPKWLMED